MKFSQSLLKLPVNSLGKDYVVGDIHGYVTQLREQLDLLGFNASTDRLIAVGDLIDRGPESAEALNLLEQPWFFSVLGNHEHLMVDSLKYHSSMKRLTWLQNGGDWITQTTPQQWKSWLDELEELPVGIEVTTPSGTRYGIVHADYPRNDWSEFSELSQKELERAIWARDNFTQRSEHRVSGIDWLIHGHNISDGELTLGNRIYIEPGSFLGNDLIIKELI